MSVRAETDGNQGAQFMILGVQHVQQPSVSVEDARKAAMQSDCFALTELELLEVLQLVIEAVSADALQRPSGATTAGEKE